MTKDNSVLSKFDLTGIPPAPRGVPQIEVTFEIDANGIIIVSAADKGSGKSESVIIKSQEGTLSDAEIQELIDESERMAEEDAKVKDRVEAKISLESYCYSVKNQLGDQVKDKIKAGNMATTNNKAIQAAVNWLKVDGASAVGIDEFRRKIHADDKTIMERAIRGALDWIKNNGNNNADAAQFMEKLAEVQGVCDPIITKIHSDLASESHTDIRHSDL
jgi:heat shock protein 5